MDESPSLAGHAADGAAALRRSAAPGLRAVRPAATGGLSTRARPKASICCSPPGELVAEVLLPRGAEEFVHTRRRPGPGLRHGREVLVHGQRAEDIAPCGTQPTPAAARRCTGGVYKPRRPAECCRHGVWWCLTRVSISVVLPVPLRPSKASDSPLPEGEGHIAQHHGLAIAAAGLRRPARAQPWAAPLVMLVSLR